MEKNSEKAHFRMGKSAYLMRKFDLALESFEACFKLNSKNTEAEAEIKKTTERINESKTGVYNFKAMYQEIFSNNNFYMDIADYRSNKIEVTDILNKSKGVVATDFIKKGTLITACKAASAIFFNKTDYRRASYNTVHCSEGIYNTKNESENISNIVYKMQDDPDLANQIYSLYGGADFGRDKLDHPTIDIKRIENIYAFNSFQNKTALEALEIVELENEIKKMKYYDEEDFGDLDLEAVDFESDSFIHLAKMQTKFNNISKQCGLWFFIAFFNHSCISNCVVNTIGDIIMIHSHKDIQKGEELTIRYFPPEWAYEDKVERATSIYGFKCDCKLCTIDEKDPKRMVRDQLLTQIESKKINRNISEAIADFQKMRQTYSNRPEPHLQLITPLEVLAEKYRENSDFKKSAKCFEDIFELTKDYNDFVSITALKEAYADFKKCSSQDKNCELCKKTAFEYFISLNLNEHYYERLWKKMSLK